MIRTLLTVSIVLGGTFPLQAAEGPFFSLGNTDFVVLIAFVVFIGAIIYFKAPKFLAQLIDGQIAQIERQLNEAASIRSDATELMRGLEKKQLEAIEHTKDIKRQADQDKDLAIKLAQSAIDTTIKRKIQNARDQIHASEAKAMKDIRDQAVELAVNSAAQVITESMGSDDRRAIVDQSIKAINTRLP